MTKQGSCSAPCAVVRSGQCGDRTEPPQAGIPQSFLGRIGGGWRSGSGCPEASETGGRECDPQGKPSGMWTNLRRRTIALAAAYAMALQALLPALALVAGASGDRLLGFAEVCLTGAKSDSGLPRQHHDGCAHGLACPASGCSGVAATLSSIPLQFGPGFSRPAVLTLHPVERSGSQIGLWHSARAPPQA